LGSGKSSFLNICRDLLKEQGFVPVTFNPWRYDERDEIWHALIQTLLDELINLASQDPSLSDGNADAGRQERVRKALKKAWEMRAAVAWLAARSAAPIITHGIVTGDAVAAFQKATSDMSSNQDEPGQRASYPDVEELYYRHINVFEKDFADTAKALAGGRKLVVLIDDLDRCRAEPALKALEALRLFTGTSSCVFMIAMDYQAIIEAASLHFGDDKQRGSNYLEKLINFPYYLPAARFGSATPERAGVGLRKAAEIQIPARSEQRPGHGA